MKYLVALTLIVTLAGCRTESADSASPEASGESPTPEDVVPPFEISAPERVDGSAQTTREVKLVSQTDDGTACYLMVENGDQMELLMAEKELCGITYEFEGERIEITQEDAVINAVSCVGDPKCPEAETVKLIVDVKRAG